MSRYRQLRRKGGKNRLVGGYKSRNESRIKAGSTDFRRVIHFYPTQESFVSRTIRIKHSDLRGGREQGGSRRIDDMKNIKTEKVTEKRDADEQVQSVTPS